MKTQTGTRRRKKKSWERDLVGVYFDVVYIGIDSGWTNGCISVLGPLGEFIGSYSIPKNKDLKELVRIVRKIGRISTRFIVAIEEVGSLPRRFAKAVPSMNKCYGALLALFTALGTSKRSVRIDELHCDVWRDIIYTRKKKPKGKPALKAKAIVVAKMLFPEAEPLLRTASCDGVAESLLIAEAGRRRIHGIADAGKLTTRKKRPTKRRKAA